MSIVSFKIDISAQSWLLSLGFDYLISKLPINPKKYEFFDLCFEIAEFYQKLNHLTPKHQFGIKVLLFKVVVLRKVG